MRACTWLSLLSKQDVRVILWRDVRDRTSKKELLYVLVFPTYKRTHVQPYVAPWNEIYIFVYIPRLTSYILRLNKYPAIDVSRDCGVSPTVRPQSLSLVRVKKRPKIWVGRSEKNVVGLFGISPRATQQWNQEISASWPTSPPPSLTVMGKHVRVRIKISNAFFRFIAFSK